MNALILAGGFGTRLYPLTKEQPKALLKINKKPVVEYILDKINEIEDIEKIYILSNNKFYINFLEWLDFFKKQNKLGDKIKVMNNGISSEKNKEGAVKDLKTALEIIENQDLLVVASDNIFGFNIKELLGLSELKNSSTIALKLIEDLELIKKYSCVLIDETKKIIYFEEKPQNPKSNLTSTACYFIKKRDLEKIKNHNFEKADNLGEIINFLHKNSIVHGVLYKEFWYDIGSISELERIQVSLA